MSSGALVPCQACRRHARVTDPVCPFCGGALDRVPRAPRVVARAPRALLFGAAATALAGCAVPAIEDGAGDADARAIATPSSGDGGDGGLAAADAADAGAEPIVAVAMYGAPGCDAAGAPSSLGGLGSGAGGLVVVGAAIALTGVARSRRRRPR